MAGAFRAVRTSNLKDFSSLYSYTAPDRNSPRSSEILRSDGDVFLCILRSHQMKKTYFLIGFVLTVAVAAFGQQQNKTASSNVSGRASGDASAASAIGPAGSMIAAGTNLEAQLESMLDVKKNKVGDEVILKTTKAIKQNGETVVPKGSKLIGRITEVKQKTKDNATSRIGMVFDRLQGKELDMPINASIVSVATAQLNAAAGDLFSTDLSGSSSTSGSASAGGRPSRGGGGGLLGGVGSTVGGVVNTTTSTVGQVAGTATNTVGNTVGHTTGTLGRTVNGLQISQSASGTASSSSTISARGKDVKIEKGATFNLRLDGSVQN